MQQGVTLNTESPEFGDTSQVEELIALSKLAADQVHRVNSLINTLKTEELTRGRRDSLTALIAHDPIGFFFSEAFEELADVVGADVLYIREKLLTHGAEPERIGNNYTAGYCMDALPHLDYQFD